MELAELKIDTEFFGAFKKLLSALKDYNKDIDLLTSQKVSVLNESILKKLIEEGFVVDHKPVETKLITKFTLPETNFEMEFLCPMFGGDPDRKGERQLVKEIQEGINAQPLRYLDLAQFQPWIVSSESISELKGLNLDIQIPSPGAYLIQKFLIRGEISRPPSSIQKDCFYTYELLLKFNKNLKEVYQSLGDIIASKSSKYTKLRTFKDDFRKYYCDSKSEGIVRIMAELKARGHNDFVESDVLDAFEDFFKLF